MVRLMASDWLGLEKEKDNTKLPERKEFIYYQEMWEGKDFRGVPLNPVIEHIEGKYDKQFTRPHINQQTGEIDYMELDSTKAQTIYYIPYSKKAVDDIIAKSVKTDKNKGITYTIKFSSPDNPFGHHTKCPQGINSPTNNSVVGHGKRFVNFSTNQAYNNMRNGLQKRNQRTGYRLNLLNYILEIIFSK